ncbi:hypothetical protein RS030_203176 [Cryptosporidium xiaoi]|uniref:Protein kinase domain-containing protein n=1 Tax=Cryptosporidium xiaoi TaxID=659607 RepID=A0AAV9XZ96_9CRYT
MDEADANIQNSYIIQKLIGSGGYGRIELVKERLSGKYYIFKTANYIELNSVIHKEESILKEIKSEFIVNCINSYTNYLGFRTLILDYFPRDLRSIIENYKKSEFSFDLNLNKDKTTDDFDKTFFFIDINTKKKILFQIISGINDIHSKSISHNDLKPENILVDKEYNIKICDFGSSVKIIDENVEFIEIIPTNIAYKSPERLLGTKNPRDLYSSDIWSFGCVALELLTGKKIYDGSSEFDQLINILKIVGTPIKDNENESTNYELDDYFCSLPSVSESGIMIPIFTENWYIKSLFKKKSNI